MQLYTAGGAFWHGRERTVQKLAEDIADKLEMPVTDATGIGGTYDYTLTFTPEAQGPPTSDAAPPEPQLGLQLQSVKNVPVDVVVLDSAKKQPIEN